MNKVKATDPFWAADLADVEATFLNGRRIESLPAYHSDRAPRQGHVALTRTVDVEAEASAFLVAARRKAVGRPSFIRRLFDRAVFGDVL